MLPAISRGAGKNICFPDVCNTPVGPATVPMPYPNIAAHDKAAAFSPNVFLGGNNALHTGTVILMTSGDEAGSAHPRIKQAGRFTTGSPVVHVNLLPGVHVGCLTTGNDMNAMLGTAVLSAVKNVFYGYADRAETLADEVAAAGRPGGPPLAGEMSAEGIGLVRIEVFSADVPARLGEVMETFEAAGARAAVIDLRKNPGGELPAFVDAAALFLPAGSLVATFVDTEGDRTEHRSFNERPFSLPLVLLVDGGTASSAELFALCLEGHGRAEVVGGPTFGKRTAHRVVVGPDGAAVRLPAGTVEIAPGP